MIGQALVIRGDARRLPLPDASVDLIVTSPPYFALRDYGYDGQIGSEATPQAFLESLWECTREWMRVLKPEGSLWVNLGDKYTTGGGHASPGSTRSPLLNNMGRKNEDQRAGHERHYRGTVKVPEGFRSKSLLGLPWRYALGCIDHLELILRAEVIWDKPNGLPESVTDRVRRSHEHWFHLVRQPRYYAAVDEIREPQRGGVVSGGQAKRGRGHGGDALASGTFSKDGGFNAYREHRGIDYNPLGKLPGSVWEIPSEPLKVPEELGVDHFAAFPTEWPKRIIAGWSPPGICTLCGQGRQPASVLAYRPNARGGTAIRSGDKGHDSRQGNGYTTRRPERLSSSTTITGYACACTPYTDHPGIGEPSGVMPSRRDAIAAGVNDNPGGGYQNRPRVGPWREYHFDGWTPPSTRPAVVLDPFGGTGTTALAAKALGRVGITVDLSADYARLAQWRVNDRGELARVLGVPKPPAPITGQTALEVS